MFVVYTYHLTLFHDLKNKKHHHFNVFLLYLYLSRLMEQSFFSKGRMIIVLEKCNIDAYFIKLYVSSNLLV